MKSHFNGMSVSGNEIFRFLSASYQAKHSPHWTHGGFISQWAEYRLQTMFCDGKDIFDHLIKIK